MSELKLKRTKIDSHVEQLMCMAAIHSTEFMRAFVPFYKPEYVLSVVARSVVGWCIAYYQKYGKAPGRDAKTIFQQHRGLMPASKSELVAEFLRQAKGSYTNNNVPFLLDSVETHFRTSSYNQLTNTVSEFVQTGDLSAAQAAITKFRSPARPVVDGFNPFTDPDVLRDAFQMSDTRLFTFPGAIGSLFGDRLNRDEFLLLMGPEKRGKTWWLMEIVFRAMLSRCNVALFELGDMSRSQITRRLAIRLAGRSDKKRYCAARAVPVLDCLHNQKGTCPYGNGRKKALKIPEACDLMNLPRHTVCTECQRRQSKANTFRGAVWHTVVPECDPLTWREAYKLGTRWFESRMKNRDFKVLDRPSGVMGIDDVNNQLDMWAEDGFIADVIVLDYFELLKSDVKDKREGEILKAQGLRSMSLQRHALVASATQSAASSYLKKSQGMEDFSETKAKLAYPTGVYALNQTREEKDRGLMRVGPIVVREDSFSITDEVTVLQDFAGGRPCLASLR